MKKALGLIFVLFAFSFAFAQVSTDSAISEKSVGSYPYYGEGYTFSRAYYQVMFDERGKAGILHKIEFLADKNMSSITIEIPGKNVEVYLAVVKGEKKVEYCNDYCLEYADECQKSDKICTQWNETNNTCDNWEEKCTLYRKVCVQNSTSCYTSSEYRFKIADVEKVSENTFKILFPESVAKGENVGLFLYYSSWGYASGNVLSYDFDFPTIKYPMNIYSTRVAVSGESGVNIKGGETSTEYNYLFSDASVAKSQAGEARELSSFSPYYNIDYSTAAVVKTKNNLSPNEVFHVTGEFAKGVLALYWKEIAAVFVIIALVLFGVKKLADKYMKKGQVQESKEAKKDEKLDYSETLVFGLSAGLVYSILTGILFLLVALLTRQYYNPMPSQEGMAIFLAFSLLLEIVGIAGIIVYFRENMKKALATAAVFFVFSAILFVVALVVIILILAALPNAAYNSAYGTQVL